MRIRSGVIGVILLGSLAALTGCSAEAESPRPVVTAGPKTDDLVVHGVVERDGKPLSGAKVWLTLWPEDDEDTKEGEVVDTWSPGAVTTQNDGAYALRIDRDELTSKYFNGDFLNFNIGVFEDGTASTWHSTVSLVDGRVWRSDEQARVGGPVLTMDFDLSKERITTTDSFGEREKSELPVGPAPAQIVGS